MADKNFKTFNINDFVWVRLTNLGIKTWRNDFIKYAPKEYTFEEHFVKFTEKGWTRFPLHELMNLFGAKTAMGMENQFETNIKINPKDLH